MALSVAKEKDTQTVLIDYDVYVMKPIEKILYTLFAAVILLVIGFIFYQNVILSLLLTPFALFYPRFKKKELIKKRRNHLNLQFKDMLYALSSSLTAGKSPESAFSDVLKDLKVLYPTSDVYIIKEVEYIVRKLNMNETVESALDDLAKRSKIEDIKNFTEVFKTCKRTGGNLVSVIRNSSDVINEKIEIKEDINTTIASKKFEHKILSFVPIIMIVLLTVTTEGYMDPLFNSILGRLVMTVSIIIMAVGYFVSRKIIDIKV
ncbi:type II secretion system F family protein [Herbivorax sp. ANBcel31]|uniref:type II secretion system F family protein n=1 Tax=Herbivorax sp. ANBcel31 TaxID=3069754 RepID=UPI0027B142CC|nr:type II secretion system F family protein [Herbivorax sp. ANBcel31]MDQ2085709.1 type II secretion system F family protein [Herbivorax sp. ANBcel31]